MKIAFIQYDIKREIQYNLDYLENILKENDAEMYVLPELSTCGYLFDNKEQLMQVASAVPNGEITKKLCMLSQKYNCALIVGLSEKDGDKIFNTAVVLNKGKYLGKYQKQHLTTLEKKLFTPGNQNCVFDIDGVKIGVQICFDIWFPEVSREQIRLGANILCGLANFGNHTTVDIAKIRAIENLTPFVLCNRIGNEKIKDIDAEFLGNSTIYNYFGQEMCKPIIHKENIQIVDVDYLEKRQNIMCKDFDCEMALHYKK